jgi:hypothetical protein
MVHLAVAVQVCSLWEGEPTPEFLLGNIAPDAIHMRPNAERSDKRRVHLEAVPDATEHERIHALLAQHWTEESEMIDFVEGYAAHILTDYLWHKTVWVPFTETAPRDLSAQERLSLYYLETDQIDFNLYHQASWRSSVWTKLAAARPKTLAPLLTAEEIEKWRDRTLRWYEELKEEPKIDPVYIADADVESFIPQAAEMVAGQFLAWKSMSR